MHGTTRRAQCTTCEHAPSSSYAQCTRLRTIRRATHRQHALRSDPAVELGRPWTEDQRLQQRPASAAPAAPGAARKRPAAAAALPAAAPGCSASTQMKATPDLWKGREHDRVSQATQKSRAARPRTSPSKDVGCCSCAELAMPEQQRSCQHSTCARIVRGEVRGRASGVRRVARASEARTAAAHPRPVGKAVRRARPHRRAPSRRRLGRSRALRRRRCS